MHVGFVTPEYVLPGRFDGGLANYVRKVATALAERDHAVTVLVSSARAARWRDGHVDVVEVVQGHPPSLLRRGRSRLYGDVLAQLRSARALADAAWRVHEHHPFDVVQASSYATPGWYLRHNGRVPLVCRVSSHTPLVRRSYGRPTTGADRLGDRLELRQVRDAAASFAPSELMASTFERAAGVTPRVIRSPVEIDVTTIARDGSVYEQRLRGRRYLLFFGTLSPIKGIDVLARALPTVLERDHTAEVVLVGRDDGFPDGRPAMDHVLQGAGRHSRRVTHLDALPKAQLVPIIEHAVGVVLPSRVDNYPNAALEAMALGVPIVATDRSSLEEVVLDGATGWVIPNGDAGELAAAMGRLLTLEDAERARMSRRSLEHAQALAAADPVGELEQLYREVTATPRVPARRGRRPWR